LIRGVHVLCPPYSKGERMDLILRFLMLICKLFTFQWIFLGLIFSLASPKIFNDPFLFMNVKVGKYFLITGYIALFSFLGIGVLKTIIEVY